MPRSSQGDSSSAVEKVGTDPHFVIEAFTIGTETRAKETLDRIDLQGGTTQL